MKKADSNRVNARRSTGPKSPAGKAKVAKNAVRHGAYSEALGLVLEDQVEFERVRAGLVAGLSPIGPLEENLVERMVSLWWRMDRAKRAANQELWMKARYALRPAFERLRNLVDGEGEDPFREAEVMDRDECRLVGAWEPDTQDRLLRHEMTLERSFFRLLHELERLQARRQGQAVLPPVAVDVNLNQPD